MVDYGITDAGFNRKPLTAILQSIQDRHRGSFGAGIDVAIATELGQLDGNFASDLAEVWELLEVAYHAFDPEAATGYALTALASITGTVPRPAAASRSMQQQFALNAGITVPAGSLVHVAGRPDIVFSVDAPVTNPGGSPAAIIGTMTCTQTGPVTVIAGSLTAIDTGVSGWTGTTNLADAQVGRNEDTPIELRQRREDELALRGGSTTRAIRADLLDFKNHPELTGINQVSVLENTGDSIDANGLLPHSVEVVIDDGTVPVVADADIRAAIWESGAAGGISTSGAVVGTIVDDNGDLQEIRFSRYTQRQVYISLHVTKGQAYPADGDAQVKAVLVALGAELRGGDEVVALAFRAAALSVAGVIDVPVYYQGFGPGPVSAPNLFPAARERAIISSLNILFV
jgi:hypothetical protein